MDRRTFLQASAAGLALSTIAPRAYAAGPKPRRVGLIGTGWYGKADLFRLIQVEPVEVVALCDADSRMLGEAAEMTASRQKSGKTPHTFRDYRELLAAEQLDLCLIATPDHWHALPMIDAVKAGADVYVQKPISVDVTEGEAMLAAARKYGRVVQVGTQRRSTPHLIEAKQRYIDSGALGTIGHVEICCYYHMRATGNPPDTAPPAHLDYDYWTGPAPMRPYNELVHPRRWRSFMEYGNGIVGDMCIHMLDAVRWMMDLGWPTRIASSGGILVQKEAKANITDTQVATFDFGGLPVVWTHRSWGDAPDPQYPWAAVFHGSKGTLKASVNSYDFLPTSGSVGGTGAVHADAVLELDQYPEDKTEKDLEKHVAPAIRGHMRDWLAAVDTRGRPVADIEQGHISTASCILANVSLALGREVHLDPQTGKVLDGEPVTAALTRPYRAPWEHPTADTV